MFERVCIFIKFTTFPVFSFFSRILILTYFFPIAVCSFFCSSLVWHCCHLAHCFWAILVLYLPYSLLLLLRPPEKALRLFQNCLCYLPFSPSTFHCCSNVILPIPPTLLPLNEFIFFLLSAFTRRREEKET